MWPFKETAEVKEDYSPTISLPATNLVNLTEQFKGEVELKEVKFPSDLGEEHPFDFLQQENLYKKFGFYTAVIDKYVDFVVGPGFYIECDDERAKTIINDFIRDVNLDTLLRAWCKEGLMKGNGFLEIGGSKVEGVKGLKRLNATYMYVKRDKKGKILEYNQYKGAFDKFAKDKVIDFTPGQIAHFPFNQVGDCAYGLGIGYPAMQLVNNLLQGSSDMHMIQNRKANSPLHVKLGKVDGSVKIIPKPADVTAFGKNVEIMKNKTDWVTDDLVDMKVVDFGNIGDKFATVLEYDLNMLIYAYQIPAVLLGMANVAEGLADSQMEGFERRIQSIQIEMEKVIENQIFKRVLEANGLDVHVEFQWGQPSAKDKLDRLLRLKELMSNMRISDSLYKLMEKDVVKLLDYDEKEFEMLAAEEEKKREAERAQPIVPGQNVNPPQIPASKKDRPPQPKATPAKATEKTKSKKKKVNESYEYKKECKHCTESWDKINDVEEWLGFNYKQYLGQIHEALMEYDFGFLAGVTKEELVAGYLTTTQIESLRKVLDAGFKSGASIKEMTEKVSKIGIKDLYRMEGGVVKKGASGLPILAKSAESRSPAIVRTEVTRIANMGAVREYKAAGVEKIRWVASFGERTCIECEGLDNQIFEVGNVPEIPAHPLCRCTLVAVDEVKDLKQKRKI